MASSPFPEPLDASGYAQSGDNRESVTWPWIEQRLRLRPFRRALDFGCGDGRFAERLARDFGASVVAYDRDPAMLDAARRRLAGSGGGTVTVATAPDASWDGAFEVALLLGVWMCWATSDECTAHLGRLRSSLVPGGRLFALVTHPCFRPHRFATYRTDFPQEAYRISGRLFRVRVGAAGNREVEFLDYHWTLADHLNQARAAGFTCHATAELPDDPAAPLPSWLAFEFVATSP